MFGTDLCCKKLAEYVHEAKAQSELQATEF